jgi:glycosyltransferase involved in cell wall biosynthesis
MIYILHTVPSEGLDPPLALLVKYALSSKKKILTVSKYAENKILQIWFHKRIKMSHVNYIHNATVAPKKLDYDGQFPVKTVLTMGHLVEYKNPKLWLRIAREVIRTLKRGTVRFVWLGQGPLYNDCIEYLTEAEKDSIIFFGYCANPQKYLCEAKVYFQPSLIESHGLAVVEAMSYGVPCVVSRIGGLPESVSDGQNGYIVDLNNENDIITKIIKLLEDDELRLEMGECSREIFQKCFSIEEWYRKMKVEFDLLCKIE